MPNENARHLRRAATDAERRLWSALRDRRLEGYRYRRQYPIGRFIVDFACTQHRLIVEADGGQHADSEPDRRRTANLEQEGWRVLRFWNNDVHSNLEAVLMMIVDALRADPSPRPRCARAPLSRPNPGFPGFGNSSSVQVGNIRLGLGSGSG